LENPKLALEGLRGLVVIDEIQRRPELFPVLRVLADRPGPPARFLILGSASRDLIRQGSETLAGRIGFGAVTPFTLGEVGVAEVEQLRDSGLLHRLAGVNDAGQLHNWPRLSASWEGFALEEIIRRADDAEEEAYFWGVHSQGELDLLLVKDGQRLGVEFTFSDSPKLTAACRMALDCLKLDQLTLVCPGDAAYELEAKVRVRSLSRIISEGWL
jgi:predicted AAA+ superfamily ATPase